MIEAFHVASSGRAVYNLGLIGLRLGNQPCCGTTGPRHDVIPEGFGLVLCLVTVLTGTLHFVEGVDHIGWRINGQQLHIPHTHAGAIFIKKFLKLGARLDLDILTAFGQRCLDRCPADDFTHHRLGSDLDRVIRLGQIEQVLTRIRNAPENNKIDIDDIFIAGDHLAFIGDIAPRRAVAADITEPDFNPVITGDLWGHYRFKRIGDMIMQPRCSGAHPFAKAQDNALLLRIDTVKAGHCPDGNCDNDDK